jgi:hypothetical protein
VTESVILACEMIEDEVRLALQAVPPSKQPPVVWIESGLHERPERLRAALQDLIGQLDEGAHTETAVTILSVRPGRGAAAERREQVQVEPVEEVRLALGFCGNALQGLKTRHLRLVFPRVDDCVSLLLNCGCAREEIPREPRHYYLTRGWFNHESSLMESMQEWEERYGVERAAKIRKTMFAGYEQVNLIDTKAYELDECLEDSQGFASDLEMEHGIVPGSVQLLERLFKGERDSEIVVVPPGEEIGFGHLVGESGASTGAHPVAGEKDGSGEE